MKCRGVETPRKDKGRRKAALGTELAVSVLLPTGCCFPVTTQAKEMLSHNFSNSASVFSPFSMLLLLSSAVCQNIWCSASHVSHSKQI